MDTLCNINQFFTNSQKQSDIGQNNNSILNKIQTINLIM